MQLQKPQNVASKLSIKQQNLSFYGWEISETKHHRCVFLKDLHVFTCFSSNSNANIQHFHLEILSANMHKLNVSQSKSAKIVHVVKDFP